jgi:hypothetical protein
MKLPGGENWTITPSPYLPFNPLGQDDMFGGFAIMTDDELKAANTKLANQQPLAILFGQDITSDKITDPKTGKPKVIGRSKGVIPSWASPNPVIKDLFLQTGVANKWWENLHLLGPGQSTFGQDYPEETRGQHASLSIMPAAKDYAAVGAWAGITKAAREAGLIKGDLNPLGPQHPAPADSQQTLCRAGKAYAQPPTVELDYKGTPVVKNNAVSKFYNDNPAAGVLSSTQASDTAESIRQSVADDKAFKAIDKLKAQRNDGSIDYRTYASEMDKLQGANPEFFKKYPYYSDTPTQQKYYGKTDEYNAIGGEYYDRRKTGQEAKNAGRRRSL